MPIRNLLQYQWHQHADEALQEESPFWNFVRHVPKFCGPERHVTEHEITIQPLMQTSSLYAIFPSPRDIWKKIVSPTLRRGSRVKLVVQGLRHWVHFKPDRP